ncbi:hypothetical protein DITRI_Ditri17bG0056400 [Diplodiscus trichospermus]
MGLLPCHFSCWKDDESQSDSSHLYSESSTFSISSQPSLLYVPSLTSQSQQHEPTPSIHYKCIGILKDRSYVFSLALAGEVLYSSSSNGEIRAWRQDSSLQDNQVDNIVATSNSASAVKSLVVLGDKLFSAHQDNKIRIWKIHNHLQQKYKCIATLPTLKDRFLRCFSEKNYVQVRRHKKSTWVNHVDTVSALAISKDCSPLYSASWDRTFKIWWTSDFKCLQSVQNAHNDAINAIVLSRDGYVYTSSADKTIKIWNKHADKNKNLLVAPLEKHKSAVNALALSSNGDVLYSGACDRSILVRERESSIRVDQQIKQLGFGGEELAKVILVWQFWKGIEG